MKVLIFGATGMVGQGAVRESLRDPSVTAVQTIGRTASGMRDPKLHEVLHQDLFHYEAIESAMSGFDACFFCLGTPSAGKSEAEYFRVTYDLTLAAAQTLSRLNPQMIFIYISGDGADSSEQGKFMWARVRGKTENALLKLPFRAVYIFRPGMIQPLDGIQSKTTAYRLLYGLLKPILPVFRALFPGVVSTTRQLGRVLIAVAQNGYEKKILRSRDLEAVYKSISKT